MTYLEKVRLMHPEAIADEIIYYDCPSQHGFHDPSNVECGDMSCKECWNRQIPIDGVSEIAVVLEPGATLPTRGHEFDGGLDLYSREAAVIPPGGNKVFDTGVHMAIPRGYAGILISKSGLNVCYDCTSTGLIDAGYTGSIAVKLYNQGDKGFGSTGAF